MKGQRGNLLSNVLKTRRKKIYPPVCPLTENRGKGKRKPHTVPAGESRQPTAPPPTPPHPSPGESSARSGELLPAAAAQDTSTRGSGLLPTLHFYSQGAREQPKETAPQGDILPRKWGTHTPSSQDIWTSFSFGQFSLCLSVSVSVPVPVSLRLFLPLCLSVFLFLHHLEPKHSSASGSLQGQLKGL